MKGIVAILTGPDGRVVATASEFENVDRERQEWLAKHQLARLVVEQACAQYIATAIDNMGCANILTQLIRQQGFVLTFIPIGWGDAA